jgi:small-conductance mechanosensitive channel
LRFAIIEAFAKHGINIPYNQQVVHIPQLDALRTLLEQRGERAGEAAKPVAEIPVGTSA